GDVVAVQVECGDDVVFLGPQQDLLQEVVGDDVLDDDVIAGLRVAELQPRAAVDLGRAEFFPGKLVAPVAEGAFRELHDVALVDKRHGNTVVVDGVVDRLADQALRAFLRHRLDAYPRGRREADAGHAHLALQEVDDLLHVLGARRPLDAGVDVLGVLAEDHHVGEVGNLHRRRHAGEVLDRPHAGVQVQGLADRDVQGADTAADRRAQRTLDGDHEVAHGVEGLVRQVDVLAVLRDRLLAGVDLHPVDAAPAAVGLLHRSVHDLLHHRRHVDADAIALDERDDGIVGNVEAEIGVAGNALPAFGHLNLVELHRLAGSGFAELQAGGTARGSAHDNTRAPFPGRSAASNASARGGTRLELRFLGGAPQRGKFGAAGDHLGELVEVARSHLALVLGGGVTAGFRLEFRLLQLHVGRQLPLAVALLKLEHGVIEGVEACEGDELELVTHRPKFALEAGDGAVVEVLAPVEGRRAVVGQQLAGILRVDGLGELPRLVDVGPRGLAPQHVRIRRV